MTKHSKYHLIIVLLTFGLLGILKGQGNGTYQMPIGRTIEQDGMDKKTHQMLLLEMKHHQNDLLGTRTEIIPYRIVPSDHPAYGCWSELDVIWPEYIDEDTREKLLITIVNQELHQDIPDYVEIGKVHYYMIKLPIGHWWNRIGG